MAQDDDFDRDPSDETPPARTSTLTIVLCFLNVVAAVGFLILLMMDYRRRADWSHAIFMHDLKIVGLPLREELTEGTSASRLALPKQRLDSAQLKDAHSKRGGKSPSEPFQNIHEAFQYKILPVHLTEAVLKEHFAGLGQHVKTLEEEVERVKAKLLDDIAEAGKNVAERAKKTKKEREMLRQILMPLTRSTEQVEALDQAIDKTPAAQLEERVAEAAQRRMLVDVLGPLEMVRGAKLKDPAEPKGGRTKLEDFKLKAADLDLARVLDHVADRDLVPLDTLKELLTRRIDAAVAQKYDPAIHFGDNWLEPDRDAIDKRKAIANLLTTIAHLRKAEEFEDKKEPTKHLLYPEGPERTIAVLGVYEYTLAYQQLTRAFLAMRPRVLELIEADREGVALLDKDDKTYRNLGGFVNSYNEELHRITLLIDRINKEENHLKDLQKQAAEYATLLKTQMDRVGDAHAALLAERKKTAAEMKKLEALQEQLFEAQRKLATAVSINLDLQRRIEEAEGLKKKN